MGMFDYVEVEVPLPDGWEPDELQTKSFDCILTTVRVAADGRLMVHLYEHEYVGDYDPGWTKDGATIPRFERVNERWEEWREPDGSKFHGVFYFYGSDRATHEWHEYKATYDHGKLESIVADERMNDRFNAILA